MVQGIGEARIGISTMETDITPYCHKIGFSPPTHPWSSQFHILCNGPMGIVYIFLWKQYQSHQYMEYERSRATYQEEKNIS